VEKFSSSDYRIDDKLSRLRWIPLHRTPPHALPTSRMLSPCWPQQFAHREDRFSPAVVDNAPLRCRGRAEGAAPRHGAWPWLSTAITGRKATSWHALTHCAVGERFPCTVRARPSLGSHVSPLPCSTGAFLCCPEARSPRHSSGLTAIVLEKYPQASTSVSSCLVTGLCVLVDVWPYRGPTAGAASRPRRGGPPSPVCRDETFCGNTPQ
jgi:hypothetical protein